MPGEEFDHWKPTAISAFITSIPVTSKTQEPITSITNLPCVKVVLVDELGKGPTKEIQTLN